MAEWAILLERPLEGLVATATYDGEEGFALDLVPCGGWYDKVANLQAYYLDYALSVGTADVEEFPKEELAEGCRYVADAQPNGFGLELVGDKVSYDKKKVVKSGKLVDFKQSSNVCNVSVKLARATGLVTGSCSLWSESEDGTKQKEITGYKAYGALALARDAASPLEDEILAAGFLTKKVKLTDVNAAGRKTTRAWAFSAPFNVMGVGRPGRRRPLGRRLGRTRRGVTPPRVHSGNDIGAERIAFRADAVLTDLAVFATPDRSRAIDFRPRIW